MWGGINIAFSVAVLVPVLCDCSWARPKTSAIAFVALVYAWFVTSVIWASQTKLIQKEADANGIHAVPSLSFWLTFLPQVMSSACMTAAKGLRKMAVKATAEDSAEGMSQAAWLAAGAAFYFGQLFTVEGSAAGAPALVFGVKVLEPLSTALLALPILNQRANWELLLSVFVACMGIMLCVVGAHGSEHKSSRHSEWKVIVGALFANVGFSTRACILKKACSQKRVPALDALWMLNLMATACGAVMFLPWLACPVVRHQRLPHLVQVVQDVHESPWQWFSVCFCYFLYQCFSVLILDCLLVESHALMVSVKHIVVVILASILSHSRLNGLMILGVVVASVGVVYYSLSPEKPEANRSLLPQSEKAETGIAGIPWTLQLTLGVIAVLGILSPLESA